MSHGNDSGAECGVCGVRDARVLTVTRLAAGAEVVVCGSHALAHSRATAPAASLEALRALVGDRRTDRERRAERDELALHLSLAFSGDRRETREERRS
ncbi:MAG: hypothetical protein IPF92_18135 [Myxococcales bacterium]|nr:hypothetical protein [Myxococcales bacterium]MBL0196174.1 hypothetical protein [Myxococcales bacterium]